MEDSKQGALGKELNFTSFVERLKAATLRKSSLNFISSYSKLLKNFIFARFLSLQAYE